MRAPDNPTSGTACRRFQISHHLALILIITPEKFLQKVSLRVRKLNLASDIAETILRFERDSLQDPGNTTAKENLHLAKEFHRILRLGKLTERDREFIINLADQPLPILPSTSSASPPGRSARPNT